MAKHLSKLSVAVLVAAALNVGPLTQAEVIGNNVSATGGLDSWSAILVVNESDTFAITNGGAQTITVEQFNVYVGAARGRVTPFVVRVNGDNNFTVQAIGTTRAAGLDYTTAGVKAFPFATAETTFILNPGGKARRGVHRCRAKRRR